MEPGAATTQCPTEKSLAPRSRRWQKSPAEVTKVLEFSGEDLKPLHEDALLSNAYTADDKKENINSK